MKKKIGLLKIYLDDIQYCLYHPQSKILKYKKKSNFRKPGNLMIKKSIQKMAFVNPYGKNVKEVKRFIYIEPKFYFKRYSFSFKSS